MKISRQLREQLDACRPGSGDLALPELAELAAAVKQDRAVAAELDHSQRFDSAAKAALDDLPVPAGLLERLLAATEANRPTPSGPPVDPHSKTRWSRRRLLAVAGSLAATVLLALAAAWLAPRRPDEVSQDELSFAAAKWMAADLDFSLRSPTGWATANLPTRFAIPRDVDASRPQRWRLLTFNEPGWSGSGVAMHLNPPAAGARAMLFIVDSRVKFKVATTPTAVTLSGFRGGAVKAMAWQTSTNRLYVLVVEERDGQRLTDFLRRVPQA